MSASDSSNLTRDTSAVLTTKDHQRNQPRCHLRELELLCREVCQRNTESTESGIEYSHRRVVDLRRIMFAGLELERTIVACEVAGQAYQHLSQWGMDIEVELAFQIMRSKLSEAVIVNTIVSFPILDNSSGNRATY